MEQRTPPPAAPDSLNHADTIWREDHRLEEAVFPRTLNGPDDAQDLGHVRLTVDLLFDEPVFPSEETITEIISALSNSILDLHDGLCESEGEALGLTGHLVRYDGPVDCDDRSADSSVPSR